MSRKIMGYLSNDDSLTAVAMAMAGQELDLSAEEWGGLGVSWLQDGRSLERKNPRVTNGVLDVLGVFSDLPSRSILGFMTEEIGAEARALQPHRFRKWLYTELDCEPESEDLAALVAQMPDFLQRNVDARYATMVRFFFLLHELFRRDLFHTAAHRREDVARACGEAMIALGEARGVPVERYQGLVMTERVMVAVALGEPLYFRRWEGIEVPEAPLFAGHQVRSAKHPHFRAVLISSLAQAPGGEHWEEVPADHVLWIDDTWQAHVAPLKR